MIGTNQREPNVNSQLQKSSFTDNTGLNISDFNGFGGSNGKRFPEQLYHDQDKQNNRQTAGYKNSANFVNSQPQTSTKPLLPESIFGSQKASQAKNDNGSVDAASFQVYHKQNVVQTNSWKQPRSYRRSELSSHRQQHYDVSNVDLNASGGGNKQLNTSVDRQYHNHANSNRSPYAGHINDD